jgi:hypothetical protein
MPGMILSHEYTAFVARRVEREQGSLFGGGTGAGIITSEDSTIEGCAAGYSMPYMPVPEPLAVQGRFAGYNQRGQMGHPFVLPVLRGRPGWTHGGTMDGVDIGRIRAVYPGLGEGKYGIPVRASVTRGREITVDMARTVWGRRSPTSLTSRVHR